MRLTGALAGLLALVAILACPGGAAAQAGIASGQEDATAARVARYWTPARMRAARPLDLVVDGRGRSWLRVGAAAAGDTAVASFRNVLTPAVAPFSFNGRIFIRRGKLSGYCSGTAIDSPTRQLVLTAGHCINSGRENGKRSVWSDYLQFVPAYKGGLAPFGAFVARRKEIHAPRQWTKHGNPDFDLGAFLTLPNSAGLDVADAVGGGATVVTDLSRHQEFRTFGYPGKAKYMKKCDSPYIGDDLLSNPFPGPPTLGIRCRWAPGASGGGWMIGDGTEINGVNTYLHLNNKTHTFGPYFSAETVGKLIRGL
jgi:V8-like Glu-specific endopeptidase